MNILGLAGAVSHDASSAILVDGEVIAAAEEERFIREKHAINQLPIESAKWCLKEAGLTGADIDVVTIPYAPISIASPARWHYAKRHWYAPDRAFAALFNGNRRFRRYKKQLKGLLTELGIDLGKTKFMPVEHHLAHASSAYHLSEFASDPGKVAILGIDGKGEYATTFFGYGEKGRIHKIKEFYDPDSLGGVYAALTEYLGFQMLDGEFKVMGMAPYGDPSRFDLSRLFTVEGGELKVNTHLVNVIGLRRYKNKDKGFYFSPKLLEWLGPKREGDEIDDPYVHYAASLQQLLEKSAISLMNHYLGDIIKANGKLCFAGGVALNVKLNQKILSETDVKDLFIQPASNDSGTALGAATYVASELGDKVKPLKHVYLGPSYDNAACLSACEKHKGQLSWTEVDNPSQVAADLLAQSHSVAWFQGRMEFGPRALGNRSILGNPSATGTADRINAQIKYRERWRPFCPSLLDTVAPEILQTSHSAPYMTITFEVAKAWKSRIPEVVHEDGTARAQVVSRNTNPRYYELIEALEKHTGNGVVLNTSLNRRGEPMVCSPDDAVAMFLGSDLQYLVMEDILVTKKAS